MAQCTFAHLVRNLLTFIHFLVFIIVIVITSHFCLKHSWNVEHDTFYFHVMLGRWERNKMDKGMRENRCSDMKIGSFAKMNYFIGLQAVPRQGPALQAAALGLPLMS